MDDSNVIRQFVITIRKTTPTRRAIRLIVTQRQNQNNELELPTITEEGNKDAVIESGRFAADYGRAWIIASHYCEEWSKFVDGKR
jgi:hypothetical protein